MYPRLETPVINDQNILQGPTKSVANIGEVTIQLKSL